MPRFFAFLVVVGLVGQIPAQTKPDSFEVEKHLNLVYNSAKDADPVKHKLDLYIPKGAKDFPVLMFVHGGTWKSGSKDLYPALGETFAKKGIGTAIINYRLSSNKGTVKHPDHIHDVAKAFAWVKENAGKYGGDTKKLFISGHSAGGHLVALLATDESYLKAEKCSIADIRGVMALSGVYTIDATVPVFHLAFSKEEGVCKAASPISHVKEKHPPFLIAYGNKDFPSLDQMAEDMNKKLNDCKCESKTLKLERDHISIVVKLAADAEDPLGKAMVEFIKK